MNYIGFLHCLHFYITISVMTFSFKYPSGLYIHKEMEFSYTDNASANQLKPNK